MTDVLIIGGGIAGSSAAIALTRRGYDVTIVERESRFRDRVRGEAVHPWGRALLREIGLEDDWRAGGLHDLPTWITYRQAEEERRFAWTDLDASALPEATFSHPTMQQHLLDVARQSGATVHVTSVDQLTRTAGTWNASLGDGSSVTAEWLIAADGSRSATRRALGINADSVAYPHAFGGMLVRGLSLDPNAAHQAHHEAGFAMVLPQGPDLARAYLLVGDDSPRPRPFTPDAFLAYVADYLPAGSCAAADAVGPLAWPQNDDVIPESVSADGAFLIGDAAGTADHAQGHGVAHMLLTLKHLFATIDDAQPDRAYAAAMAGAGDILRAHAHWSAPLLSGFGAEADTLRADVARARETDPSAAGFARIFLDGPRGQNIDEQTRRAFLGTDV